MEASRKWAKEVLKEFSPDTRRGGDPNISLPDFLEGIQGRGNDAWTGEGPDSEQLFPIDAGNATTTDQGDSPADEVRELTEDLRDASEVSHWAPVDGAEFRSLSDLQLRNLDF